MRSRRSATSLPAVAKHDEAAALASVLFRVDFALVLGVVKHDAAALASAPAELRAGREIVQPSPLKCGRATVSAQAAPKPALVPNRSAQRAIFSVLLHHHRYFQHQRCAQLVEAWSSMICRPFCHPSGQGYLPGERDVAAATD